MLVSVIFTLLYVIVSINLGMYVLNLLNILEPEKSSIHKITVSFIVGLSILSYLFLFLGLFLSINKTFIGIILLVGILLTWIHKKQYFLCIKELGAQLRKIFSLPLSLRIISFIIFGYLLFFLLISLFLPPSGDSAAFYMVWSKIIAYTQQIIPQPNYYEFSQIGFSGELHFAVLIAIGGTESATFLVGFVAISIVALVVCICSQLGVGKYGIILTVSFIVTSTAFLSVIPAGNVNLFSAAFALLSYYFIFEFIKNDNIKNLTFCGIFAGISCVAKFSYVVVILPSIALLILLKYLYLKISAVCGLKKTFKSGLFFLFVFILAVIPHYIKNYTLFKEPFAPFFYLQQGLTSWTNQVWFTPDVTRRILSVYPIALTFGKYPMQRGNITPLLIIFFPFLFLYKKEKPFLRSENLPYHIGIIGIISVVVWMIIQPSILAPRYILASLFLLVFPYSIVLENFVKVKNIYKVMVVLTIIITFVFAGVDGFRGTGAIQVIRNIAKSTIGQSKKITTPYYDSSIFINNVAQKNDRVFLAGYYSYYFRPDILVHMNNQYDDEIMYSLINENDIVSAFINSDFSYIIVQKASHGTIINFEEKIITSEEGRIERIYNDSDSAVYRVKRF